MSKFEKVWLAIKDSELENSFLTFDDVEKISGIPIDHSFLKYKKELLDFGYEIKKISMKEEKIFFNKIDI